MAFPAVQATNNSIGSGTSHTVSLPSGISVGDLLVVFFATDGDNTVTNWGGFTGIYTGSNGTAASLHVGWKIAVGSDTLTITTSVSEPSAHVTYRITGHNTSQMPEASSGSILSTQTPDPDSLTPTGGAKDYLWIAVEGNDHTDVVTAWPTNFTGSQVNRSEGSNGGCGVAACTYNSNASVLDPAAYTITGTEQTLACTVAVHPVAGATAEPVVGTATSSVSTPTTILSLLLSLTGTKTAAATATGSLVRKRTATSTVTATGTASAILNVRVAEPVVGTATAAGTSTAVLNLNRILTSTVTAAGTASAALVRMTPLPSGTATATGSVTSTLSLTLPLVSTVTATGSVVGVLDVSSVGGVQLVAGTGTATATATALLSPTRWITSTVTASGSATADLFATKPLVSTVTATGTATATLVVGTPFVGTATAVGSVTSDLHVDRFIASTVTATGAATADLDMLYGLVSTVTAGGTASAVLTVEGGIPVVGTATANVTASSELSMIYAMIATVTANATATGVLTGGSPIAPAVAPITRQWSAVGWGRRRGT